jgi:hypothetical protein
VKIAKADITFLTERKGWLWTLGMAVVSSGLDKRGWSHSAVAVPTGLTGACIGFLISRLTQKVSRRPRSDA